MLYFFLLNFSKHWFKDENAQIGIKKEIGNCKVPRAEFYLILFLGE